MRVVVLEDEVHAGCGGQVRERIYPEQQEAMQRRFRELIAAGAMTQADADAALKKRVLECMLCGAESAEYGTMYEPLSEQLRTAPAPPKPQEP